MPPRKLIDFSLMINGDPRLPPDLAGIRRFLEAVNDARPIWRLTAGTTAPQEGEQAVELARRQ